MGAVPDTVANCAELMLGVVKVGLATVVARVDAPVIVPLPSMVIGIIYCSLLAEDRHIYVITIE